MKQITNEEELAVAMVKLLPLVEKHKRVGGARRFFSSQEAGELWELSNGVQNYYVNHKIWADSKDYDKAIREVDVFKLFYHRESARARVLSARQPEIFGRARRS